MSNLVKMARFKASIRVGKDPKGAEFFNKVADKIERLTAEIEKLQDEAIHNEGVMVALKEGYEQRGIEIEKLKELINRGVR